MFEYLEQFNSVQKIVILVCEHISSGSSKNKIANKLLTYKSYE